MMLPLLFSNKVQNFCILFTCRLCCYRESIFRPITSGAAVFSRRPEV